MPHQQADSRPCRSDEPPRNARHYEDQFWPVWHCPLTTRRRASPLTPDRPCYGQVTVAAEAVAVHREPGSNPERAKDIAFAAEAEFLLPDIPDSYLLRRAST